MPKLRKKSGAQVRQSVRQAVTNFRERPEHNDRARNSQQLATRRENEEYRERERERDRINRNLRRSGASGSRNTERDQDLLTHSLRRQNSELREIEQERNTREHFMRRQNSEFREIERQRDSLNHSLIRSDPVNRAVEQERNTREHSVRRQNSELREIERQRDSEYHLIVRSDPVNRATEQERNTREHFMRRQNSEFREIERQRDSLNHSLIRSDPVNRAVEQERNTREHSVRRQNSELREIERQRDSEYHLIARSDPVNRATEQERNTREHFMRRQNSEFREIERQRDAQYHSYLRSDPTNRSREQQRNTTQRSQRREILEIREQERERDALAHSIRRSDEDYREQEQDRNTSSRRESRATSRILTQDLNRMRDCRVLIYRMDPTNRQTENERQANRNREIRQNLSPDARSQILETDRQRHTARMLGSFNENVKKGPTEICVCCGGLWFPNQVKQLNITNYPNLPQVFFLSEIFPSENNMYKFCNTCVKGVRGNRVPNLCLQNGLHFPTIPNELIDLTALEERFVAPRIPFMRVVSLGYNRQCAVRGAVVNVPIDLDNTVNVLPRTFDQTEVIQVHLKRRLEYNHSFMTEVIRPGKVLEAARYLVNTELYRKHSVTISEDWLNNVESQEAVPFISNREDQALVDRLINDNIEDNVEELNPQETLLENNPVENVSIGRISVAPGEGRRPLDLLSDEDSEELSYPSMYCGMKRTSAATPAMIGKSEARRYDRRCARMDKVLYTYKKVELYKIKSSISTCLRKKVGPNTHTAENMLDENYVQNLVQHDEGYHILKGVRSSPAHWEGEKKKVLAMIRQFNLPTFFITLSAAESQWCELLVILVKLLEDKEITEEEAANYSTLEKYNLIRKDPVTCSRYFDQRIRHLFKHFKANGGIFEEHKVIKFYWRIEFQQRGSPHVHGIYWLENAPILDISDLTTFAPVVSFIDRFVTTDSTITDVENYVSYQEHNHSRSCQREVRGQKVCRFHIPRPPMQDTQILLPLPENMDKNEREKHEENFNKIHNLLNAKLTAEQKSQLESFNLFLSNERINLTNEEYILALRSTLKKPQVFPKRTFKDIAVNAFNPLILSMQRANMDIQYVLDAYACVSYIVNYINKSNRGVSRLLQEAMDEIRAGNYTVKQRLQHIGNKFISASEVSGQEASYNILGLHLSQCSNAEVFINTFVPEKRVRMLKPRHELQDLPAASTDIYQKNLLDHYCKRPDSMANKCLAEFAAFYKFSKSPRRQQQEDDYFENENLIEDEVGAALPLRDGSGYVFMKRNPAIIRFPVFSVDVSRGDYFRSIVMLYLPWRDELVELLENNNEQTCTDHKDTIEQNRVKFEIFKVGELEEILQKIQEENNEPVTEDNNVAVTQMLDDEFRALAVPEIDNNINILNINDDTRPNRENDNDDVRLIRLPPLINQEDLLTSVRTLNVKQHTYLNHILCNIVENVKFCEYVGGGAGVGKSRLIKSIYQSVTHRLNTIPGSNPDLPKVLLSAPTGKAAFGIGGATLHSVFSLPVNQSSSEIRPLSNDTVNSIIAKFIDLKLLIIDEISMVGIKMFGHLDARLKQIYKSTEPFGGLSIIVFGDLKQLPPVGDKWIFHTDLSNPYGIIVGEALWHKFFFYELTEIMRQREDQSFAMALNAMAVGQMKDEDIELIKSRVVVNKNELPTDAIHLFSTNKEVEKHNEERLGKIETEQFQSKAFDIVKTDSLTVAQKNNIINNACQNLKTSETQGLCSKLILKSTAKYMMTVNIETSDGLVNGATGILMETELYNNTRDPKTLWIHFFEENVGIEARRKKQHPTEPLWTPVVKCVRSFTVKRNQLITVDRKQFPVVVAEGITIHKSQGATYSKVVVNSRSRISRPMLYVACSRATSASGLFIFNKFDPPTPLKNSDPVKMELERLRSAKALCLETHFMENNNLQLKLFYQNIQSLHAHFEDILTDPIILQSDIICLVETWTLSSEEYVLPNFEVLGRLNVNFTTNGTRPRRGIIVYMKSDKFSNAELLLQKHVSLLDEEEENDEQSAYIMQYIVIRYNELFFIVLYRGASFPQGVLKRELIGIITQLENDFGAENGNIFIIGDFNICRNTVEQSITEKYLNNKRLFSLLDKKVSTTKHGTQIDWAFTNTNLDTTITKIYRTIHSYHDGILIAIR